MRLLFIAAVVKIALGLMVVPWIPASAPLPIHALPTWYYVVLLLIFGTSGGLLYSGGGRDWRAQALATVFVLFGSMFTDRLAARALLPGGGVLVMLGRAAATVQLVALNPYVFWRFAWTFPRVQSALVPPWVPRIFTRLAAGAGWALLAGNLLVAALQAQGVDAGAIGLRLSPSSEYGWFWQIVSLLTVPSLVLLALKLRAANPIERRRLVWVVTGIAVGTFPMVVHVFLATLVPAYAAFALAPARSRTVGIVLTAFSLAIPAATAYAVLVDRVLEVRFVIRRAVQYALARYTVWALMGGLLAALVYVIYTQRHRPLADILGNSPISVAALAATVLVVVSRRRLLETIDRRFFRDHYDARRILVELVDHSRKADTTKDLTRLITNEVDRALHLERIALLVYDEGTNQLRDPDGRLSNLDADGPLGSLIAGAHSPLDVDISSDSSPLARLPQGEREWLVDTSSRLIVPLFGSDQRPLGVLALGEKRSELPFTAEDRQLMMAVAASAALSLEQRLHRESPNPDAGAPARTHAARQCVVCGRILGRQDSSCTACGGSVENALLPAVLGGKFEIERQIGAGGMGVVYRARDLLLDRVVAMKVLPRVLPQAVARLRREARAMAMIQHPNLAVVHAMESWRGAPVLVLEYLAGGTLADRLRFGPLPFDELIRTGVVMADVLHYLHRAGCLHRDIKPSNIGYTEEGVPKLLDFGLVQLFPTSTVAAPSDTTHTAIPLFESAPAAAPGVETARPAAPESGAQPFVGTPAYVSPDTLAMAPLTQAVDLWGLAITLYEALIGRNPFTAPTVAETLSLVARADVPDPRTIRPDCPAAFAAFFLTALARDPGSRPQTASEFGAALRKLAADRNAREVA